MIPAPFDYVRASSASDAVRRIADAAEQGKEAKFLAGGHSLLPLMKLRFAAPETLVDVSRLGELNYIREADDHIAIGALTRHHDIEFSSLLRRQIPLLAHAAGQVGDPQVRHRGTIGGSLAHGDPASDLPAVVLALDGTIVVAGPTGERRIPAGEFFVGYWETALAPDELLTEVRVPKPASTGWSFQKFTRRAIDWAIVGVAAQGSAVALINMGLTPLRATEVESALASGATPSEAAAHAAAGTEPSSDGGGSAEYRTHLAQVLVRRALEESLAG